jgi:hypothetical protein
MTCNIGWLKDDCEVDRIAFALPSALSLSFALPSVLTFPAVRVQPSCDE